MRHLEPRAEAHAGHGYLLLAHAPAAKRGRRSSRARGDPAPRALPGAGLDAYSPGVRLPFPEDPPLPVPVRRPPVSLDDVMDGAGCAQGPALTRPRRARP